MNRTITPSFRVILLAAVAMAGIIGTAIAADFPDVPTWYWAWTYIQGVTDAGVSSGYDDGYYRPSLTVSRDQMAVFVARAMCEGEANVPAGPPSATFSDVPNTGYGEGGTDPYWAYKYIEYAVANHVVAGYDDGLYHPDWLVTRGQMAAFMARAMCGGDDSVPEPSGTPRFPDVTDSISSWCYRYVEYIAGEGVTLGYPDGLYYPDVLCARDQMAAYLCRAFDLPMPAQPYNVTEYFPLAEGNSWTYETEDGVHTKTVSGTETLHGRLFSRLLNQADGSIDYWQAQPEGLYLGGFYQPAEGRISYDPAFHIANGMDIGDLVNDEEATAYLDSSSAGTAWFDYHFVDVEDVTVPAGTFQGCMKLMMSVQVMDEPEEQFYVWVARGVGIVKFEAGDLSGHWEVLISANVNGTSYPANTGPFRLTDYRPLDVGSTLVYTGSDEVSVEQIVGVDKIGDVEAARIAQGPADSNPPRQYFAVVDDALSLVAEYISDTSTLLTFSPPVEFPIAPSIGDSGSVTAQVYDGDMPSGTATLDWAVVGAGPVSVPAGEFDNCVKLRTAITDPMFGGERRESYTWLALGVGPIKDDSRSFGGSYWRELTSAKVLGVEFPLGDRLFNITDYLDLTVGNQWMYGPLTTAVLGTAARGGHDWALLGTPAAVDAPYRYLRTDGLGLYELGSLGGAWTNWEYDPPLLVANGLAAGNGGEQTSVYLENGSDVGNADFAYTFDGIEAVSTEAGLFSDCMRLNCSLHLPTMATGTAQAETLWYTRGVGLVKSQGNSTDKQLTQASVAGVSYPPGDTEFTVTDYMPIAIDNQWAYIEQGEGWYGASTDIVDGTQFVSGLGITDTVYKLSRYDSDGYNGSTLIAIRDSGIAFYGHVESDGSVFVVNPPLLVPNGAKVGDSGTAPSTMYTWETDHWQTAGSVVGFWGLPEAGPVTTSAGHFRDCVLLRWGVEAEGLEGMVNYLWCARGVGPVKTYGVGRSGWEEATGATIGGVSFPADIAPSTPIDATIPQGSAIGFDFSSGMPVAQPDSQDLQYIYSSAQNAHVESFDAAGVSRSIGQGQYGFESLRAYSTFLPPDWDLSGQAWSIQQWVLGIGWDAIEDTMVVRTREGDYALIHITSATSTELGIEYVYPYGFFGE